MVDNLLSRSKFYYFEKNEEKSIGGMIMVKRPDYSDLADLKTSTQLRKERQDKAIMCDIEAIDKAVESDDMDRIKKLHMSIDAKYNAYIPNWGHSMYSYFDKLGFNYEYLDQESLVHNLTLMKASLEGYFYSFPKAESVSRIYDDRVIGPQKGYTRNANSNKVFIVHGHDNEAKQETARTLERAGLEAIILHEQANLGNTIMEKLEKYTNVSYAIVLYTECDKGRAKYEDVDQERNRARQNVVFEHGYLIGKLGRDRVFALVKGDVETPGDISGVVYTQMDGAGAWKLSMAKDMRAAGLDIHMDDWV